MHCLNLGCGEDKFRDYVNLDNNASVNPDVLHDLDVFPWPFHDDEFDQVAAQDVIEHVADPMAFIRECWRVLKVGGVLNLRTPDWRHENSWIDITHKHHFAQNSFDYFDPGTELGAKYGYYTDRKFKILSRQVAPDGNIAMLMEKR